VRDVNEEIVLLLELQEKDRKRARLELEKNRLEARAAQCRKRLEEERAAVEALRQHLLELERSSRLKNLEVDELDLHTRTYQKRLDEGIISFKEMEALRTKIATERERMSALEDEALATMDAIETTRAELRAAEEKLARRTQELVAAVEEIEREIAEVSETIASCGTERAAIAARARPHLLGRYEVLRADFADPVVAVTNGSCSGCKLRVSGNTIERSRNGSDIVTCENCSRILYIA